MITEDYVSFEVAKLLKEKGFDWRCFGYYVDDEPDDVKYSLLCENNSTWESRCCSAPTLQMAMKWLREVYRLHVYPDYVDFIRRDKVEVWVIKIVDMKTFKEYSLEYTEASYEKACEAAIKYCLKHLIYDS